MAKTKPHIARAQKYNTTDETWYNITDATSQTLGPENFAKGDQIKVIYTPYDGQDYGTPQEVTITISNAAPEVTSWYPSTDPTINETQSQTFNVTCFDADGDTLNITWYIYYSNGTLKDQTPGDTYTFYAEESSAGTYTIILVVSDGQNETSHQWILTVQPTP